MNLDVKLGGLGPDYEAVREKVRVTDSILSAFYVAKLCKVS